MGEDRKKCCGGGFKKFFVAVLVLAILGVGGSAGWDVYKGKPVFTTIKGLAHLHHDHVAK